MKETCAVLDAAKPFMESDDDDDDDDDEVEEEDMSSKDAAPLIVAALKMGGHTQQENAKLLYDLQDKVHELQGNQE